MNFAAAARGARAACSSCATAALKMMAEEGVLAIITPSRDGGDGGGTGIIFDDNGANLVRDAQTRRLALSRFRMP